MMIKSAILLFFVIGFSIGADALKCYNNDREEHQEDCAGEDQKCLRILFEKSRDWIPVGCSDTCDRAYLKFPPSAIERCEECNMDLCNEKKEEALKLKCYDGPRENLHVVMYCQNDDDKCVQILSEEKQDWISLGCAPSCPLNNPDVINCLECNTDECNKKELECYSSEEKKLVECNPGEKCITVTLTDGGAVERKCGKCEAGDKNCIACEKYQCNNPPLMCQNTTNQPNACPFPNKCFTITNGVRVVDKGCGNCKQKEKRPDETCADCNTEECNKEPAKLLNCYNNSNVNEQCMNLRHNCITIKNKRGIPVKKGCGNCNNDLENCKECNSVLCNKEGPVKYLKCQNSSNLPEQCTDPEHVCYTRDISGNPMQKGCGSCEDFDGDKNYHGHPVQMECTECDIDDCNNKQILNIKCYTHKDSSLETCAPGLNCTVTRNDNDVKWGCDFCAGKENCNECSENGCNNIKDHWPKCLAGAGNAAGDFYMEMECEQFLRGPKEMNITATCITEVVEGVTYKECGSCRSFVHPVRVPSDLLPPEQGGKPNIRKCVECEGNLCNAGMANRLPPIAFCLLLLIGGCTLLIMRMFIGV